MTTHSLIRALLRFELLAGLLAAGPVHALPAQQPVLPDPLGANCALDCDTLAAQPPLYSNGFFSDVSCDLRGAEQTLADDFFVPSDSELCSIFVYGGYFPDNVPVEDHFQVLIRQDDGGLPGATLYWDTLAATTRAKTGKSFFGVEEWVYDISPASPVLLPAGTYWLEVFNDTGLGTDDWFWERGALGTGVPFSAYGYDTPGAAWKISDLELAMLICGRVVLEPSSSSCDGQDRARSGAEVAVDGVTLEPGRTVTLRGASPHQAAYLLVGDGVGAAPPFDGTRGTLCLAGGSRFGSYSLDVGRTDAAGRFEVDISSSLSGGPDFGLPIPGARIVPGDTWSFQYWYRQPAGLPAAFSTTVSVTFR